MHGDVTDGIEFPKPIPESGENAELTQFPKMFFFQVCESYLGWYEKRRPVSWITYWKMYKSSVALADLIWRSACD